MKNLFKRSIALLCIVAMLLSVLPVALAAEEEQLQFVVLSTTDMHGRCWDENILNDTKMNNSMLNVATAVAKARETYGENVVLVDNGDTYQGTPVSTYQISQFTQGATTDPNPMAISMKYIGYDLANLGNHEFNYAWDTMDATYDYLAEDEEGLAGLPTVCANLYYDGTDGVHEAGENVMTPYTTKRFEDEKGNQYKIAILCFVTPDCTRWDVPDNYPGMRFSHPDNPDLSIRWEAERYLDIIEDKEAPDFVIVAFHSGAGSAVADEDLVYGVNTENQVYSMIAGTVGIDMVIAGHDHSESYSNKTYKNAQGEDVLVVNGGGNSLTTSVFTITKYGQVELVSSKNEKLSNHAADAGLKTLLQPYADAASGYVNATCGKAVGEWNKVTKFYLEQSDTMDLIGRAQMAQGSVHMAEKYDTEEKLAALYAETGLDHITVDLSSTSVVINGNYNVKAGDLSMKDIYRMYRYDNSLYLLPVSGAEIKAILEFNAATHLSVNTASGTPVFSTTGDDFTNPIFYGIDFKYDMSREKYDRIIDLKFSNGDEVVEDKMYILAVNNYHLGNASGPFADYTTEDTIWSQTDDMGGGFVQDLIAEFLAAETEANGGVAPAPSNWEIVYTGEIVAGKAEGEFIGDLVDPNTLVEGDQVMIYYPAGNTLVSPVASGNKLTPSEDVTTGVNDEGVKQAGTNTASNIFTVKKYEDGTVAFLSSDGKVMTSGATGNSLSMTEGFNDCSCWTFEATDGGWYVHNVGANYNGNHNQYLEYYSGFTTYGLGGGGAIYTFNFYKLPVAEEEKEVVILYTNDVHTYIGNDGLRYSNVAQLKQELWYQGKDVILVDAGDHIQGTAYGSMDKGETIIELMNAADYDIATLGNHEFDYGMERILELVEKADFHYVSSNFYHEENGQKKDTVLDSLVLIERGGFKIGVIGITTPESFTKSTPAYFQDENGNYIYGISGGEDGAELYADVQKAIDLIREDADIVIALGHLGDDPASKPWTSEEVIANVTGLDAFIDGHSHSTVEYKEVADKEGNIVVLTQTGQYLDAVGMMTITEEGISTELITEIQYRNETVEAIENAWIAEVDTMLGEVIAKNEVDFRISDDDGNRLIRKQETNLGDFAADALYYLFDVTEGLGADLAIMNGGGIRANMPVGDVSYQTTKTVHTFGNVACLIEVTGQQILDALEWGAKNVGVGENGGLLHVSGVTYEIHSYIPSTVQADDKSVWTGAPTGEYRVKNVKIGGEPLDLSKTYKMAGYNYTLRDLGDGFAMFDGAVNIKDYVMQDYLVLANYAKNFPDATIKADNSPLGANYGDINGEGRIVIVSEEPTECEHVWDEGVETVEPTCGEPGEFTFTCTLCSETKTEVIPATEEHNFDNGAVTLEPTCTVAGIKTYTCADCGATEIETIPATEEHNFVDGVCTVCGGILVVNPFTDVAEDQWYHDYIVAAYYADLISGMTETTFAPEENVTRAQFAMILYRAVGAPGTEGMENPFTDLRDEWYRDAIIFLTNIGVVYGTTDTTFDPDANITREQMIAMLYRAYKLAMGEVVEEDALSRFVDKESVSAYALEAMNWAAAYGILSGTTIEGKTGLYIDPQGTATRAQAAKVMVDFLISFGE